jgi:hypothetical protein
MGEILPNAVVDDQVILKVQKAANYMLSSLPLAELTKRQHGFHTLHDQIGQLLEELGGYSKQLNIPFDSTPKTINQLITLSQIAANAPFDLLEFRRPSLFTLRLEELLVVAEEAQHLEKLQHQFLEEEFYLDSIPDMDELKTALRTFRRWGGFFNFLNKEWRTAKRLFHGISKSKKKLKASEYEAKTTNILKWIEKRTRFIEQDGFKEAFGPLFRGLESDFSRIRCLSFAF